MEMEHYVKVDAKNQQVVSMEAKSPRYTPEPPVPLPGIEKSAVPKQKSLWGISLWAIIVAVVALLGIVAAVVAVLFFGQVTDAPPSAPPTRNCDLSNSSTLLVSDDGKFTVQADACANTTCSAGFECLANVCDNGPCCVQPVRVNNAVELEAALAAQSEIIVLEDSGLDDSFYVLNRTLTVSKPTLLVGPGRMQNALRAPVPSSNALFSLDTCAGLKLSAVTVTKSGFSPTFVGDTSAIEIAGSVIREPVCGEGWVNFNGEKCVQVLLTTEPKSWVDANDECGTYGGRLLSVTELRESEQLGVSCFQCVDAWIGGQVTPAGDEIAFTNGITTLEDWFIFEGGVVGNPSACLALGSQIAPLWTSYDCSETRQFLCERDIDTSTSSIYYGMIESSPTARLTTSKNRLVVDSYASMELIVSNAAGDDGVEYDDSATAQTFAIPETLEITVLIEHTTGATICELQALDDSDNELTIRVIDSGNAAAIDGDGDTCATDTALLAIVELPFTAGKLSKILILNSTVAGATVTVDSREVTPIASSDPFVEVPVTLSKFRVIAFGVFDVSQTIQFASDLATPTAITISGDGSSMDAGTDFLPRFYQFHRSSTASPILVDEIASMEVYSYGNTGIARVDLNDLFRECAQVRFLGSPTFSEYAQTGTGIVFERDLTLDLGSSGCRQLSLWSEPSLPVQYQLLLDAPPGQAGAVSVFYPETLFVDNGEINDITLGTPIDLRPATEIPRNISIQAPAGQVCMTSVSIQRYGQTIASSDVPGLARLPNTVTNCETMCPLLTTQLSGEECVSIGPGAIETVVKSIQVDLFESGCGQIVDIVSGLDETAEEVCTKTVNSITTAAQMNSEIAAAQDYSTLVLVLGTDLPPSAAPTAAPTTDAGEEGEAEVVPVEDEVFVFDMGTLVSTQVLRLVFHPARADVTTIIANGAVSVTKNAVFSVLAMQLNESMVVTVEDGQLVLIETDVNCNITCGATNSSCFFSSVVVTADGRIDSQGSLQLEYSTITTTASVFSGGPLSLQNMVIQNEKELVPLAEISTVDVKEARPTFVPDTGDVAPPIGGVEEEGVDVVFSNVSSFETCTTECEEREDCHSFWYEAQEPDNENRDVGICKLCLDSPCSSTGGESATYLLRDEIFNFIEYPGCLAAESANVFLLFNAGFQACKAWCTYYVPCRAVTHVSGVCRLYRIDDITDDCGGASETVVFLPERGSFGQELKTPYAQIPSVDLTNQIDCSRDEVLANLTSESQCSSICDAHIECQGFSFDESTGCQLYSQESPLEEGASCAVGWSPVPIDFETSEVFISVRDHFPQVEYFDLDLQCLPSSAFDRLQVAKLSDCQIICDVFFACVAIAFANPVETQIVENCVLLNVEEQDKLYFPGFCDSSHDEFDVFTGVVKRDFVLLETFDPDANETAEEENDCDLVSAEGLVDVRTHTEIVSLDDCKAVCSRYVGCSRFGYDLAAEACHIPLPNLLRCALEDISLKEFYPAGCDTPSCYEHTTLASAREKCLELGYDSCQGVVQLGTGMYEVRAPSRLVQTGVALSTDNTTTTTFLFECLSEYEVLTVDEANERRLEPTPMFSIVNFFAFVSLEYLGFTEGELSLIPHAVQPTVFNIIVKTQQTPTISTYTYVESPTNQVAWLICFSVINNFAFSTSTVALVSADKSIEYRVVVNLGGAVDLFVRDSGGEETFGNITNVRFTDSMALLCNDGLQAIQVIYNFAVIFEVPAVCNDSPEDRLFPEVGIETPLSAVCHLDVTSKPVASDINRDLVVAAERDVLLCQGNESEVFELVEEATSGSKTTYVHNYEYYSFANAGTGAEFLERRLGLTREQCEKFCDVHFLCSGYGFRFNYQQTSDGFGGLIRLEANGTDCFLLNSIFVTENELFLYEEVFLFDFYTSTANPFRDLYTPLPNSSCFLFDNFQNDTIVEGLSDIVDCKRACFESDDCAAFTWNGNQLLCTLRLNSIYIDGNSGCPPSAESDAHFIAALEGFYAPATDVLFGSTPVRDFAFYQDVNQRECEALCNVKNDCNSIGHGTLVVGNGNRTGLIYEDACFLLGKTLEQFDQVEDDLNSRLRNTTIDDVNEQLTELTFFNFFDVYSFTTVNKGTSRDLCPSEDSLIIAVEGADLFECEALCDSHELCGSIEINEAAECKIYLKTAELLSRSDDVFFCRGAGTTSTTYRLAIDQFVDPSPVYHLHSDPFGFTDNELCIFGDSTVVSDIRSVAHCRSTCRDNACGLAKFNATTNECTLFSEGYAMELCDALPEKGLYLIAHDPAQYTQVSDKCLTSPGTTLAFESKTQEDCAAICLARRSCRTFTLTSSGLCTLHDSAEYGPCITPGPALYRRFFELPYAHLRDKYCVARSSPIFETRGATVEGCRFICDQLEVCNAFEIDQSGDCRLYQGADFSTVCQTGARDLYISLKHVLEPEQESTFHGFSEDVCILRDGSPLTPLGSLMTQAECEAACLSSDTCRAYEHQSASSQCFLLEVENENATVADNVEYTTSCPSAPGTTKLRAETNPYKIQNLVDLGGSENELDDMTFDDKESFECIALCDFHPFCRAFKYFIETRSCTLYKQAREGFGALAIPESGVEVYVNVHAFVDIVSFVGAPGVPFGTLIDLSYSECAAICVVHDSCNSFTHTSNYRFMEANSLSQDRRLITEVISTGPGPQDLDHFVLKKQILVSNTKPRLAIQRVSHTSDNSDDHEIFLDAGVGSRDSRVVFTRSNDCVQSSVRSTENIDVGGQVFQVAVYGDCNDFFSRYFNIRRFLDGFISIEDIFSGECLSYDNRPGIVRDGADEVSVFWAPCGSGFGERFAFATPRFHMAVEDTTTNTLLCFGTDALLRDCKIDTDRARWMYDFQSKQIMEAEVYLEEEMCLVPGGLPGQTITKVACSTLTGTEGQYLLDGNGRIVHESSGLCVTAQTNGDLALRSCSVGGGVISTQKFRDFATCELRTSGNSPAGVLSRNADGDGAIPTTNVSGLDSSYYVQDLSSTKLLLTSYDFNRSVIVIVGYTALNEPQFLDPSLGDTCLKRAAFQPGLVAGPCWDSSLSVPVAESLWANEENGRRFTFSAGALVFVLCRQGNSVFSLRDTDCGFEESRWMLALRQDSTREGTEVAIEPGPLPVLPEIPAELLFRLWLQSPDGRLVRSMQAKIEIMRALVGITERQLDEADQALADATASLRELDRVSSTVEDTTRRNAQTSRVLADVLLIVRPIPYIGPVSSVIRRVLDRGAGVLEKGSRFVSKGQKAFQNLAASADTFGTGLLSGFVVLRPPVEILDTLRESLARVQACAFFSGIEEKQLAVEGVIRDISQAADFATAGMATVSKSLQVLNRMKPEIILSTGIQPLRNILNGMRPVTRIMNALRFIERIVTYVISFKVPIVGRVRFSILDIARVIGRIIGIVKRIPFFGWVAGWIEKAVIALIRAILPPISLPLPNFNINFAGPFEAIRKQIEAEAAKIVNTATEIQERLQGSLTGLLPVDVDFSTGVDIPSILPADVPELPCFDVECALQLPALAPFTSDINELRAFIDQRLAGLDPNFLSSQFSNYLDSLVGCNETTRVRIPLGEVVPEEMRVDECNVGDPEVDVCTGPVFGADAILQNITDTMNYIIDFTPSQRRMLRGLSEALPSCGLDYCFESLNFLIAALETRLSKAIRSGFLFRKGKTAFDGLSKSVEFSNTAIGVGFDFIVEGDLGFKFDENGDLIFLPGYEVIGTVSIQFNTVPRAEKAWVVFNQINQNMVQNFLEARVVSECLNTGAAAPPTRLCLDITNLEREYRLDTRWSKSLARRVRDLVRIMETRVDFNGRPRRSARKLLQRLEKKKLTALFRRHAENIRKRLRQRLERAEKQITLIRARDPGRKTFDTIPFAEQGAFLGVVLRPDVQPRAPNVVGNAVVFEFNSALIATNLPKTVYVVVAPPMDGFGFISGFKPRIGVFTTTKPMLLTITGCLAYDFFCKGLSSGDCSKDLVEEACRVSVANKFALKTSFAVKVSWAYGLGEPLRGKPIGAV